MRLARTLFTHTPLTRALLVAGLSSLLGTSTQLVWAAAEHRHAHTHTANSSTDTTDSTTDTLAVQHTQALLALSKQWQQAQGNEKSRALQQLTAQVKLRRAALLELMESNPAQAMKAALSEQQRAEMPLEVQSQLEQTVTLEGEYEAIYEEDFEAGTARLHQFVNTPFGDRLALHVAGSRPDIPSGHTVQLEGLLFEQSSDASDTNGALLLDDSGILIMGATSGSNGGSVGPLPNTFGERRVAVMMINFQDVKDTPWTKAQMQDMFFNKVSNFYRENSYNQTWLSGDVLGWYTLPVNGASSCPSNFDDLANTMAQAAGVNLSAYAHHVYLIPPTSACARNASTVGGSPSRTWISSATNMHTVSHEFGHTLGLGHARALDCTGGVLESNCRDVNYGDIHDVMGQNLGHLNAFHKEKLGWLGYNQSPAITTVTTSGTYTISPLSAGNSTTPKALKIWKGIDAATGKDSWYYLEYRQAIGHDSGLFVKTSYNNPEQLANGTVVHTAVEAAHNGHMLDMTPDSSSITSFDLQDPALEVGYSYHDQAAGITITPLSATSSGLTLDINISGSGSSGGSSGSGTPTNRAPVANNDSAITTEGQAVTISVLANDTDPDGDALSVTSLSGVNGSATINSNGTVTYTPPAGFSGTTTFNYTLSDGRGGSSSATVTVTVNTASSGGGGSNTADITLTGSLTKNKGTKIATLNWSNATTSNVGIYRDGSLLLNTANDGAHEDRFEGKANRDYKVCEVGTNRCSAVVNISG